MAVDLESFDELLETGTREPLGDTITYAPSGGAALPAFKAIADMGDNVEQLSGSKVIGGDCAIEVPKSIVAVPTGADVVTLAKRPGEQFLPKDWKADEAGMSWLIVLKKKPA